MKKNSREKKLGACLADGIIEAAHMMYNARRGTKIIEACIKRLQEGIKGLKPKKADEEYKKARYGKKRPGK